MKINILFVAFVITLMATLRSDAAIVTFGAPTTISADTDVSTTGTLLYAFTLGNTSVPAATVNGVTFSSFAVPNGSTAPVTIGHLTMTFSGDGNFDSTNADNSTSTPYAILSTAYQGLLQSGIGVFQGTSTLTLGGLTNGYTYQVQFWSQDTNNFLSSNTASTQFIAGNSVMLKNNSTNSNGGVGQWATGVFTADATTQLFTLPGGGSDGVLNGLQVRTVSAPEPGSAGLLGVGSILIAARRRRSTARV